MARSHMIDRPRIDVGLVLTTAHRVQVTRALKESKGMRVNIAVVGLGYWGPNLARNVATVQEACLHTLCDARADRLAQIARQYPGVRTQTDYAAVLADSTVDAVIIATPLHTHFELAR